MKQKLLRIEINNFNPCNWWHHYHKLYWYFIGIRNVNRRCWFDVAN
nr:MAG TPA: hypothetical protein [Caudoviricetes sp.]